MLAFETMSSGFAPLVFVLGALVGAAAALTMVALGAGPLDGPKRRYTVKIVTITCLSTLVVTLVLGYAVVRWKFRVREVTRVSVKDALESYRKRKPNTVKTDPGNAPPAGVYTYKGKGFTELDAPVLGNDRRELRGDTVGTLVANGDCWEIKVQFFKQEWWSAHYCRPAPGGVGMRGWKSHNEYFGRVLDLTYTCKPPDLVRADAAPGAAWQQVCRADDDPNAEPKVSTITFVGRDTIQIGGATVPCYHVRRVIKTSGRQVGRTERNLWFRVSDGLLVRVRERSKSRGLASFESDFELTLAKTAPTK